MALSSPGIGSNMDVDGIVKQLMALEARPLTALAKKEASYQAKLTAFGTLSGVLSSFQSAVSALSIPTKFQGSTAASSDGTVLGATATSKAVAGIYNVNVSQLAQAQTLTSAGRASASAQIGNPATTTTLTFQFGEISGGSFVSTGAKLSAGIAAAGITPNSLSINGTTITTDGTTNSASALAAKINLATGSTGVTATAQATDTGSLGAFTTTTGAATYSLVVGGVSIISNAAIGTTATDIDASVQAAAGDLTTAGIAFSGAAVDGTLRFTKADGTNIAIQESGVGAGGGFTGSIGNGATKTFTAAVSLSSPNPVTIGGSNPGNAGFSPGVLTSGTYTGASFAQDAAKASGTVTIDGSNNSLQGIRDAINKANLGVTASIVSDGSAEPYRLVLKSDKTGETSSLKIDVSGDADIAALLRYDPAGTQKLTQTSAARNTELTVNGVAVTSATTTVTDAIQGVTLNIAKSGTSNLTVARDTGAVTSAVNSFVKAYNDLNKTLKELTSYNASTKQAGILIGDSTVRSVQNGVRQALSEVIPELSGSSIKSLSDLGVAFQKDGTLAVDSSKLQKAIANNFSDIAAVFAATGKTTDSLVNFVGSSSATKPGTYALDVTTLATRGKTTGASPASLTITAGVNDQLGITVDGIATTVTLGAGTYSSIDALVSHVQSAINGASAFSSAGIAVTASADASNIISITSNRYGSASSVTVSGTGANDLLGAGRTESAGVDVAGTINGVAATGSGQILTGATGSVVEGLKVEVTGAALGSRGTISFTQGYAYRLNKFVDGYLGSSGMVSGRTKGINSSIEDLKKQSDSINQRLSGIEKRYRAQFTALDTMMSSMTKTSSFLTQQLANLPKIE